MVLLVLPATIEKVPLDSQVIPEENVNDPGMFQFCAPMIVPVNPVQSTLFAYIASEELSTTNPDPLLASKYTFSPVGTLAPLAPPEVVAQFVVDPHAPFPQDTQYLLPIEFPDHPRLFVVTNVLFAPSFQVAPPNTSTSRSDI